MGMGIVMAMAMAGAVVPIKCIPRPGYKVGMLLPFHKINPINVGQ